MRLGEVILYVEDLEAQVAFYRDTLGLKVHNPDGIQYGWIELDTGSCRLCLHAGGKKRLGEDAPKFVFHVEDIEKTRAELAAKSVRVGEVHTPHPGVVIADGFDPEGNKFSLEKEK